MKLLTSNSKVEQGEEFGWLTLAQQWAPGDISTHEV